MATHTLVLYCSVLLLVEGLCSPVVSVPERFSPTLGAGNIARNLQELVNTFLIDLEEQKGVIPLSEAVCQHISKTLTAFEGRPFATENDQWHDVQVTEAFNIVDLFQLADRPTSVEIALKIIKISYRCDNFTLIGCISGNIEAGGLNITEAEIEFHVGENFSHIAILGTVLIPDLKLNFSVRISQSPFDTVMYMVAMDCWYNAFKLPFDVCNMEGSVTLNHTHITEIALGASEIQLGGFSNCSAHRPLLFRGYIGLSVYELQNSYYHASIPQGLTISDLLDLFCIQLNLTSDHPVAKSGFEPGFLSSFTANPHGISVTDNLYIPPGFQLNGTLNIFGTMVPVNARIDFSDAFYATIALLPLEVGSVFHMFAPNGNKVQGPYMFMYFGTNRLPYVTINGKVSVLGISSVVSLMLTKESMSVTIEGRILNIAEARITLTAPYNLNSPFSSSDFCIEGYFKQAFFAEIEDVIIQAADNVANAALKAVHSAQQGVNAARLAVDQASTFFENARRNVGKFQMEVDKALDQVEAALERFNSACRIRDCDFVCLRWCRNCACKITDPVCFASNKGCQLLRVPFEWLLNGARNTLRKFNESLDVAREILFNAERALDEASRKLGIAIDFLGRVKQTHREGLNLTSEIGIWGLRGLFVIKDITFKRTLRDATNGQLSITVRARVLGNLQTISLNINLYRKTETILCPLASTLGNSELIKRIDHLTSDE